MKARNCIAAFTNIDCIFIVMKTEQCVMRNISKAVEMLRPWSWRFFSVVGLSAK